MGDLRKQDAQSNNREFITSLGKLAMYYKFGKYQTKALRNQLLFRLTSEKIQDQLLEIREY